jgi:phosphatidylinositol alpha-1,6-mannosyltransferase
MAGKPRLLVLTPDFPPAHGGIQLVAHAIVRHTQRFRCRVVTLGAPSAGHFNADTDLDVVRVAPSRLGHRVSMMRLNAAAVREAVRFRPHAVLSLHIVAAPAACALRRALGLRFVQYLHADELAHRRRLGALALRHAAAAIAVSRYTRSLAADLAPDGERVRVIPNGVDLPDRRGRNRSVQPTILTVARMDELYKGHDTLARALPIVLASAPDARWVIVGDGVLRPWVQRLVSAHDVEGSVQFLGRVSDEERDDWFERAHVFAMPARVPPGGGGEGYGIAYLEAGAHGLPVVAGNAGGALDAVADGETGILVDPTDHVAVAEALTELLVDGARAEALGRVGEERARELAWPHVVSRIEEVLLEVMRGG